MLVNVSEQPAVPRLRSSTGQKKRLAQTGNPCCGMIPGVWLETWYTWRPRVPDIVDAPWSEQQPGDQHQRAVQGREVVIVALFVHLARQEVHRRRPAVSVRVLPDPAPRAVGVDHHCLRIGILDVLGEEVGAGTNTAAV